MSRSFAKNNGKTTFAQFKEPFNAGEYILLKKNKYIYYNSCCYSNINLANYINNTQLYTNLITKLDLSDNIVVISDLSGGTYPVKINTDIEPYLKYNIDPSGNLFGNTICGLNNWENYIRADIIDSVPTTNA